MQEGLGPDLRRAQPGLGDGEILSETVLPVTLGSEKWKLVRGIKVTSFLSKVASESLTEPRIEIGSGTQSDHF